MDLHASFPKNNVSEVFCVANRLDAASDLHDPADVQVRRILAGDEVLLTKLSKALLESYVDDNKEAKWCPSTPHCGNAIKASLSYVHSSCTSVTNARLPVVQ